MARKTLARIAAPVTELSGGIDQISAAPRKLHATYAGQVVEVMNNPSASRREMAIQPLREPE